jgi:hypothetical protein
LGSIAVTVLLLGILSSWLTFGIDCGGVPPLATASALPDPRSIVADLDGDGRPDLAIVKALGWGQKGFSYQLELNLSTHPAPSSFAITAKGSGLQIVARDVDGDGDLDLVVTTEWPPAPVGVWINDKHDHFALDSGDAISAYLASDRGIAWSADDVHRAAALTCCGTHASDLSMSGGLFHPHLKEYSSIPIYQTVTCRLRHRRRSERAPPVPAIKS